MKGEEIMIKLIGVVIILVGLVLKLDTLGVVLVAGLSTGLVSGLGIGEILSIIGEAFISTRYMSIFLLTLPVIGILENNGLQERASILIKGMKSMTAGKVLSVYTFIRMGAAALSLRLGGHVQFIRPLINPMAYVASAAKYPNITEKEEEQIKGYAAASENYGNFFGQNVFVASGGVLLVVGTLKEFGIEVRPLEVAKSAIPVMIIAFIYAIIQFYMMDRKIHKVLDNANQREQKKGV
jgi:uncharacterized membrane protein